MRRGDEAVLVEGYTDALMAHQAGFENVVASLGTALTPAQVAVIARYAREIVLAYDVDPPASMPARSAARSFCVSSARSRRRTRASKSRVCVLLDCRRARTRTR